MEWIPTITLKAALAGFDALGLNRSALLEAIRVEEAQLGDAYAAVPDQVFEQLWLQAFKQDGSSTLATRAGLAVPYGEFGLLDHLVNTATTVGEGLHILNLFLWLVASNIVLAFSHDDGDWLWVLNDPPQSGSDVSTQWTLALILNRMKSRVSGFDINEVWLTQVPRGPSDATAFADIWGAPVSLAQEKTGFKLVEGAWQLKNEGATPDLKETLQDLAERVDIRQFNDAPLTYAVRARLPQALQAQAFAAEDVAQALNLSKRTLQRKLAHEDVSFTQLLDRYREEKAMSMLLHTPSIASVAYALGYEEQSSFNRAFKRWTGLTPSEWLSRDQ